MSLIQSPRFLRRVMSADAASCLACGGVQLAFADRLAGMFSLPASLLAVTGAMLLAFAVLGVLFALPAKPPRTGVWLFVVGNFAWAAGCALLLFGGVVAPTALGIAWIVLQGLTVIVLAELQWMALRRPARSAAAAA